ncbi:MAG: T9SS type A sorting domain-containing protein [Calditrichia bacterium]
MMNVALARLIFLLVVLNVCIFAQTPWQSQLVFYDAQGKLQYAKDATGNRIPDFSYAGYRNSNEPIPDVPVVMTISPIAGDNTQHIQNAIIAMNSVPLDSSGFRGAVLLTAGEYEVSGIIRLNVSGVVLRGEGDGEDPVTNTVVNATGNSPAQRDVLIAGGGVANSWGDSLSGSQRSIVTDSVMLGDTQFEVSDASPYSVGDNIIITHPCTPAWLAAIDSGGTFSDEPGATGSDIPWQPDSQPIVYNRYIKEVNGNQITIDAPLFANLIRSLSQAYVYIERSFSLRKNIGIENLRIDIDAASGTDENHAWNGIYLIQVEDAWVRNCTVLHFGLSGIYTNTASRITIEKCQALDPASIIEGGKRYNFNAYTASQQILFKQCHATNGRHSYMSNGTSYTSGIVFLDCTASGSYAGSEGHRRWSQGLLYDNHKELDGPRSGVNPRLIGLYNRGYFGTSHGWSAAHSVAWACDVNNGEIHVQQPPTSQNYAIGCFGTITGDRPPCSFDVPAGYIEGSNTEGLNPRSLFLAQLEDRGILVGLSEPSVVNGNVPEFFELQQNFPNPFNPTTTFRFSIQKSAIAFLKIVNNRGQVVLKTQSKKLAAGQHNFLWQADQLPSGIYFYSLWVDGIRTATRKALLIK